MFRTLTSGDSISVSLRKLLRESREGESVYTQVCDKGNRQSECQTSCIKLRNLGFFVWEDASLWAHWIHSFHMHLSYLGPILFTLRSGRWLLFVFPQLQPWAITTAGGSIHWITVLGAIIHIWRPKIANGCDISCLLILFCPMSESPSRKREGF